MDTIMQAITTGLSWFFTTIASTPHQFWWGLLPSALGIWYLADAILHEKIGKIEGKKRFPGGDAGHVLLVFYFFEIILWLCILISFTVKKEGNLETLAFPPKFSDHIIAALILALAVYGVALVLFNPGTYVAIWNGMKRVGAWFKRGWNRLVERLHLRRLRLEQKRAEEHRLSGEGIASEFRQKRDELIGMIGESRILGGLVESIARLVDVELPRYLNLRRYLIENVPAVRKAAQAGDGNGLAKAEAAQSASILKELEDKLAKIEATIQRMRLALIHLVPVIVKARAGLASESATLESVMTELVQYSDAIRTSVDDATAADEALVSAYRETIAQPVTPEPVSLVPLEEGTTPESKNDDPAPKTAAVRS